tara:strand:+ start:77 stop:511 length:435 start_codon:yes stop_codon:yes gene_type:complete
MKSFHFLLVLSFSLLFISCSEDEADSFTENLVYTVFEVNNGNSIDFTFYTQAGTESFSASSNNETFTTKTFSATTISGTTFYYMMQMLILNVANTTGCVEVSAKTYHNNSLYEEKDYSIGYETYPTNVCANSTGFSEMYGIIAE